MKKEFEREWVHCLTPKGNLLELGASESCSECSFLGQGRRCNIWRLAKEKSTRFTLDHEWGQSPDWCPLQHGPVTVSRRKEDEK